MRIDSYSFGRIVIQGEQFTTDVIIFPDRVYHPWWRKEGHLLQWEDLEEVLKNPPEVLFIGRGYSGVMEVPKALVERLERLGIEVHVGRTQEVVDLYNRTEQRNKVAALHLTC